MGPAQRGTSGITSVSGVKSEWFVKVCKVSCHDRSEVQCSRDLRKRLEKAISFFAKSTRWKPRIVLQVHLHLIV